MTQTRDPWTLVAAVSIGNTIGLTPSTITAFLVGGLMDDLGFSEIQAGTLGTIEMMTVAATSMLVAPFMAKLPVVRVAVFGVLLAGLAQLGSALLDSFWLLIGTRFASGVGSGLVLAASTTAAAGAVNPDRLYGYAIAGFMGLMSLLTPVLASIIEARGIAGGYATLGGVFLLLSPLLIWLGRTRRAVVITGSPGHSVPRGELVLLMAVMVMFGLGPGPVWSFMERIGVGIGIEAERVGSIYSMAILCGLGSSLFAGALGARWGRTGPLTLAFLMQGVSCLGFGFVSSEVGYASMMVLFWLSYMFLNVFLFATVAAFDPVGRVGPAAVGSFMLVLGLGPALGGVLVTAGTYQTPSWFAMFICGLGALLVALLGGPLNRLGATPPSPSERV